jgi:hypothetical protein
MAPLGEGNDLFDARKDLLALRDAIRVQLHLAGMDARDEFARLEKEVSHALSGATRHAVASLIRRLELLRNRISSGEG